MKIIRRSWSWNLELASSIPWNWFAYLNSMRFHALEECLSNAQNSKLLAWPWIGLISESHDTSFRNIWWKEISEPHLSSFSVGPGANATASKAMDCDNAIKILAERQSKRVTVLLNNFPLWNRVCGSRIIKYRDTEAIFWVFLCRHGVLSDQINSNSVLPASWRNKNTVCRIFMGPRWLRRSLCSLDEIRMFKDEEYARLGARGKRKSYDLIA